MSRSTSEYTVDKLIFKEKTSEISVVRYRSSQVNMKTSKFRIAIVSLCFFSEVFCILNDDINYQENQYNQRHFPVNQNGYYQREFKFMPEKNNWSEKFAATVSQAVEEQNSEPFTNLQENKPYFQPQNTIPQAPFWPEQNSQEAAINDNENISNDPISPSSEAKVTVTHAETPSPYTATTPNQDIKDQDLVNIPSYPPHQHYSNDEKGEILIHRPAPIIVKRPPTKVIVSHPPLIVKPSPVIFHRPPSVIVRPVIIKSNPQPVRMQPVYVKVIKPSAENIYMKEKMPCNENHYDPEYYAKRRDYSGLYGYE